MWGWVGVDQWIDVWLTPGTRAMAEDGGTMRDLKPSPNRDLITLQFIWECVIAIKANLRSLKDPHNRGN
jgi:hypothetical protein